MKTIEEKAEAYETSLIGHNPQRGYGLIHDAYIAGAHDALASQWRSVKDELPPHNTPVFVLRGIGSLPDLSFYRRNGIFTHDIDLMIVPEVTHWMYVPEMPKSEKGE